MENSLAINKECGEALKIAVDIIKDADSKYHDFKVMQIKKDAESLLIGYYIYTLATYPAYLYRSMGYKDYLALAMKTINDQFMQHKNENCLMIERKFREEFDLYLVRYPTPKYDISLLKWRLFNLKNSIKSYDANIPKDDEPPNLDTISSKRERDTDSETDMKEEPELRKKTKT